VYKIIRTSTVPMSRNLLLKGQLKFLNQHFDVLAVSGAGKDLAEVGAREGVAVVPLSMERKISPLKDLQSFVKLFLLFRKEKPVIVHSITPKAGLLTMSAAWFADVPIRMHTFTGLIFPTHRGLMQRILILMDRILCRFATNIYPEGAGVKKDLINFKITKKPLTVLANGNVNGIDLDYFNPDLDDRFQVEALKSSLGLLEEHFTFVYVGRLVADKGLNELVEAFKRVNANNASVRLLLVGESQGEADQLAQNTLYEIQNNPAIISVGFQADIRPYLAISKALILPSYREGFPNVVLQAGAMGLPCIVTNINGSNEIIINQENGLVVPVRDIPGMTTAMQLIFEDDGLYNKMRSNTRELIKSRYEQHVVWKALLDEYNRVLAAKGL
jgi:glycosyltransferase involved in cell wall biosynthesis